MEMDTTLSDETLADFTEFIESQTQYIPVSKWWLNLVMVHSDLGMQAGEKIKEAALNYFLAWGLLGTVLTSISFMGALMENSIPSVDQIDAEWAVVVRPIIETVFLMIFMYTFVAAMRSVICSTFKYLLIVQCPPDCIIDGIKIYVSSGMNAGMSAKDPSLWELLNPPAWDHVTPVLYSCVALAWGAALAASVQYGVGLGLQAPIVLLPIYYFAREFSKAVFQIKHEYWKASSDMYKTILAKKRIKWAEKQQAITLGTQEDHVHDLGTQHQAQHVSPGDHIDHNDQNLPLCDHNLHLNDNDLPHYDDVNLSHNDLHLHHEHHEHRRSPRFRSRVQAY